MNEYIQAIMDVYPNLLIRSVEVNQEGQNNIVLIVNQRLIFRFPRYIEAVPSLHVETALLKYLQHRLPLPVPNPIYYYLEPEEGAFIGYKMLPGRPLWRESFFELSESVHQRIARRLGKFLKALHHIPMGSSELESNDTLEEWHDIYERIQHQLFPYMSQQAIEEVTNHFETHFSRTSSFDFTPALRHGDFGASNILFDRKVTGIIDFSGACLGDPAYDFAGLLASYGERFLTHMNRHYPGLKKIMHRVRFYQGTFALLEALFGVEYDDPEAFAAGIADYREEY